ncbi:MAG TPA: type II toxin-antitoxin system PemK/MazF family toxin [Rhizomicrobium sp.]|jgi:mRNA interferase MazF
MTDIPFGAIVLADFPFTDLSATKRRPALVVSTNNAARTDIVVAFITSVPQSHPDAAPIAPGRQNGLKHQSSVRFDKIATVSKRIIAGRIGSADPDWLKLQRTTFFSVFGFDRP